MKIQSEPVKKPVPGSKSDPAVSKENPAGFAKEFEPAWTPPEAKPEPRPVEPILSQD